VSGPAAGQLPHLMASVVVLDATLAHTLLVRSPDAHRWTLATGHVSGGEPIAEAARRELADQTGLSGFTIVEPHLGVQQDLTDCGSGGGATRHIDHVFLARTAAVEPAPSTGSAAWFPVDALPSPLAPGVGLQVRSALRLADPL
jgi:ADP-ribose pyrophosphatase YjhB (NUDIX family)